jgi:arabinoxylan arabinofuranohydrolase
LGEEERRVGGADGGAEREALLFTTCDQKTGAMSIGVTVADSPLGPFKDAIGKPLIANSREDIDPTVFIDSDGQA